MESVVPGPLQVRCLSQCFSRLSMSVHWSSLRAAEGGGALAPSAAAAAIDGCYAQLAGRFDEERGRLWRRAQGAGRDQKSAVLDKLVCVRLIGG